MSEVRLDGVHKSFGEHRAVDGVDLTIQDGEFLTLLGASGSGKTTCLRMIAGFVSPDRGRVLLGGQDATRLGVHKRNMGIVFQSYALFPHMTVAANVAYGLKMRRLSRSVVAQQTQEALELVHLDALGTRYPRQLSGGQRQRVALARAIAIRPSVLLLDEPLSALDLNLRTEMQDEIRRIQQALRITTLFVTHDQGEAFSMSDRVAVMRNGRIVQLATPAALYQRPNSRYVASFVGRSNFLEAVVVQTAASERSLVRLTVLPNQVFEVAISGEMPSPGAKVIVSVRPEYAYITAQVETSLPARVQKTTYTGERWVVDCTHAGGLFTVSLPGWRQPPSVNTQIDIGWSSEHAILLKVDDDATAH